MGYPVLIAAELRNLLEPDQLAGLDVTWLPADQPTPTSGDWVAVVPLLTRWMGGTEFKNLRKLRIVANVAVGFDNVDVVAAQMHNVAVTNTPDVLTDATADLTWALILACARRIPEGINLIRSGKWIGWHPEQLLGMELRGKTLGLFGAGRIGQAVGVRAVPFGLRIIYASRSPKPRFEEETGAVRVAMGTLLQDADILSLHVPATPETKGIINQDTLSRLKPGAILVNTSRGDLVREDALAIALETGRLGSAGLDVYADEPNVHPRLVTAPRTVLLPHVGSATRDTRRRMAATAIANVQYVLRGEAPVTPVFR